MKWLRYGWVLLLAVTISGAAQEICSVDIPRAFTRAASACREVDRNQVCLGNGAVAGVFDDAFEGSFDLIGERAPAWLMQQLIVDSTDEFSVATMQLQLSLVNTQPGRNVSLVAFGDVTITNQVPVRPIIPVESTGVLIVRSMPDIEAESIAQYPLRTTLTADGLHADGNWLRVEVPNTSAIGWVARSLITTNADVNMLNLVDVDTPFLRPFQLMSLVTDAGNSPCADEVQSGVLLQSPNVVDAVNISINGVELLLYGTLYIQAVPDSALVLRQLDGHTFVQSNNQNQWIVSGGEISIPLDQGLTVSGNISEMVPFDPEDVVGIPLNNLNYRIRMPNNVTQNSLEALVADLEAEPVIISLVHEMTSKRCVRITSRNTMLYAGPGTFYEIIRVAPVGSRVYPVLRLADSDGVTWWQLSNSHWILASYATSEGDCPQVPVTEVIETPDFNVLVLETCDTTNGPIREGQWVEIEFLIGSFRTLGEAQQAPYIDHGMVTVNNQWIYVSAGEPFKVAEERFYRKFSGSWYAESGTFRIVGSRLTYSVICDVTVPVG